MAVFVVYELNPRRVPAGNCEGTFLAVRAALALAESWPRAWESVLSEVLRKDWEDKRREGETDEEGRGKSPYYCLNRFCHA